MKGRFYLHDGNLNVRRVILETIKIAGVLSLALAAPNAVRLVKTLEKFSKPKYRNWYINQTIEKLIKQKLIKVEKNSNDHKTLSLTSVGQDLLDRYEMLDLQIKKPKKWDRKYRLVIFDIKEGKRKVRDDLRRWLEGLGFLRLQNSVWVYPYDCREVVVLLKSNLGIGTEVLYLVVDSIEDGYKLRKAFGL